MNRPDPTIPIPDDLAEWFPAIGMDVQEWRGILAPFIKQRDGLCWVTGCEGHTFSHMHEYIRRSYVQGWPRPWRVLIHCPFGSVMLCDEHHEHNEPAPEEIAAWMCDTYGAHDYCSWARSLPFKSKHPLDGFLRKKGY